MADLCFGKMFHSSVFLVVFVLISAGGIHVMQQDNACSDIEGTWALKPDEKSNATAYLRIKKSGFLFRLESSTENFAEKLPFKSEPTESTNRDLNAVLVQASEFIAAAAADQNTGPSEDECKITLQNGVILKKVQTVNHVHVVYMNHLDVGYNTNQDYPGTNVLMPGYILNVLNWYFQVYFPRAIRLGNELRDIKATETFIYTTHPWLVNLYLDCPKLKLSDVELQCPTEEQLVAFRRAVWMGDINWHAGPLNQEAEASNPELYAYSLTLSQKLDKAFNLTKKYRTMSQRDIPGMTHAAIPYLVENGIAAVSFGVNQASAPPDVPSPNVWKFGNQSVITFWHKGGYPNEPGPDPQHPQGLSRKDCQFVKNLDHVLCFAFRTDNYGPPKNVQEIKRYFKILRFEYPGADIRASTLEDFTQHVIPLRNELPVVSKEIGDTWIQGPQSDPIKMSHYRTINRLRSKCIKEKRCDLNDKRFDDMSRLLVKLPEHTYGISSDFDSKHWSNEDFLPLQYQQIGFKNDSMTWLSHRAFNDLATNALKDHPLADEIRTELKKLEPYLPDLDNYKFHDNNEEITCSNGMKLRVGAHGGLVQLTDGDGNEWADEQHPLAQILYKTYDTRDFKINHDLYTWINEVGFDKPGMDYAKPESKFWPVLNHGTYVSKNGDPCSGIFVRVIHEDMETWFQYGAPVSYYLKYTVHNGSIDIDYQFFNKPSTRLPEALSLNFEPKPQPKHQWYLHKLGYLVNPMNIVNNGSQYVHAIDQGVAYIDSAMKGLVVESLDVATVLIKTEDHDPSPFPTPMTPMKTPPTGMAFNFYNNIWETNFIFWYPYQPQDKHYKARFRMSFR